MCGIAGIVSHSDSSSLSELLQVMCETIQHRGPDDAGVFVESPCALGHRRLSILDLSSNGHQPMHSADSCIIVYNGEVYNYLEIREELIALGCTFATGTDTEVILAAYSHWGTDCVNRFTGMWAFAIYDKSKSQLFCSRDRFGIKPFYYHFDGKCFRFASEINAILNSGVSAKADVDIIADYLLAGMTDHTERTFFNGIYQLLPGNNLILDTRSVTFKCESYYTLDVKENENLSPEDYVSLFKNSIRLHLRSDVPIGTCLSGGLDSSTVAALASQELSRQAGASFGAVTAQSELSANDESKYAKLVVNHCGLTWHTVKPTYADFSAAIEDCLRIQNEPVLSPSVFMQYCVMKMAHESGIKVMLDGQGGDECLLGYERYYPSFFVQLAARGRVATLIREFILATQKSKLTFKSLVSYSIYFLIWPLRRRHLKKRSSFLSTEVLEGALDRLHNMCGSFLNVRALQIEELVRYNLPQLLRYEDRNSMAHSIEARVPFIEHKSIEAAVALPASNKIRNGFTKYPLRMLAENVLPHEIAWRTNKIGFEAPDALWLERHLPVMREAVAASALLKHLCKEMPDVARLPLGVRWKLYNIAVWEKQFNVSA